MCLCQDWYADLQSSGRVNTNSSISLTTSDSHCFSELHGVHDWSVSVCYWLCENIHCVLVCVCVCTRLKKGLFLKPPEGWLYIPTDQTSQVTMDSVWMKYLSIPFTYSSRRKIFLQGCPPEMWHSHARRPAATLPTRFSIKQANNTIPTPINKWSFLDKVLYTETLTEATHHTLMPPCTGQTYFSSLLALCVSRAGEQSQWR